MRAPTEQEITREIRELWEMKPNVCRTSVLGDDHHAAINAQMTVLNERLSEDQVHDRADDENWADNVRDEAVAAARWLAGQVSEHQRLVDGWKRLLTATRA